jgi:hypothetical protein
VRNRILRGEGEIPHPSTICTVNGLVCGVSKDIEEYRMKNLAVRTKNSKIIDELHRKGGLREAENNTPVLILNVGQGSGDEGGAVEVRFLSGKFKGQTGIVSRWFMWQPK